MNSRTRWSMMCAAALLAASTAGAADETCSYGGKSYSDGGQACQSGGVYRCDDGEWKATGTPCPASTGAAPVAAPRGTRTCMYQNATVASGSSICKAGSRVTL